VTNPIENPRDRWLRNATKPVTTFFDQRFTDLHQHLDHRIDELEARLERLEAMIGAAGAGAGGGASTGGGEHNAQYDELVTRVQRFSDEFAARAERIAQAYEELLARARSEG
jgi:hypothetical protein